MAPTIAAVTDVFAQLEEISIVLGIQYSFIDFLSAFFSISTNWSNHKSFTFTLGKVFLFLSSPQAFSFLFVLISCLNKTLSSSSGNKEEWANYSTKKWEKVCKIFLKRKVET